MTDISLIANSGIQFQTFKIKLGQKSQAMKLSGDFFEKEEEDVDGNKEYTFVFPYYHEKKQRFIELTEEIQTILEVSGACPLPPLPSPGSITSVWFWTVPGRA